MRTLDHKLYINTAMAEAIVKLQQARSHAARSASATENDALSQKFDDMALIIDDMISAIRKGMFPGYDFDELMAAATDIENGL